MLNSSTAGTELNCDAGANEEADSRELKSLLSSSKVLADSAD